MQPYPFCSAMCELNKTENFWLMLLCALYARSSYDRAFMLLLALWSFYEWELFRHYILHSAHWSKKPISLHFMKNRTYQISISNSYYHFTNCLKGLNLKFYLILPTDLLENDLENCIKNSCHFVGKKTLIKNCVLCIGKCTNFDFFVNILIG